MALNATIYKIALSIADLNRSHFGDYALTLARHPSETEERLAVRILAYALNADERLEFGKGLSADDEPTLGRKDLTGQYELWLDVGQPDPRRLRRACGRASQVIVVNYGGRSADLWWQENKGDLADRRNLAVLDLAPEALAGVARLVKRNCTFHITIQEDSLLLSDGNESTEVHVTVRHAATTS